MGAPKKPVVESGIELCKSVGCKAKESKFTFCEEHYEHFKFGLITKEGKKVLDYEKKWDHYLAFKKKEAAKKAA